MTEIDAIDGFDAGLEALEGALDGAAQMTGAFSAELIRMQATVNDTGRDVGMLSGGISRGLRRAFDGLAFDGLKLSEALKGVARSMLDAAYSAAMRPVTGHFGGLLAEGVASVMNGLLPFEKGAGFTQGRVMPFARGGIVTAPVRFPMRGGTGLMGEAGPEAILPLARGSDGRLGVRSEGGAGRPVQVVMNIRTPDAEGFRRSRSQIAAEVGRAIQRGNRNR
ncbi:phage tail tape measure protein [Frigidibacter sp. ROC022]|uniref:phage tail tape measure protein n=1 Tax=Frigidibacter sp. ROC022 TaxID=2971796 RepID=UPI00215A6B86|nr:phage tail tape measure protein [Frigidibacter sp. ROC022]MCR8723632.1 phage tail tape measure protein [Frigidibacter sp. ROC022]